MAKPRKRSRETALAVGLVLGTLLLGGLLALPLASVALAAPAAAAVPGPVATAVAPPAGTGSSGLVARVSPGSPIPPDAMDPTPAGQPARRTDLPMTGPDIGGMVALGVTMVVAGVLLVTVRRRGGRSTLRTLPDDDGYTWLAPTDELPSWPAPR